MTPTKFYQCCFEIIGFMLAGGLGAVVMHKLTRLILDHLNRRKLLRNVREAHRHTLNHERDEMAKKLEAHFNKQKENKP